MESDLELTLVDGKASQELSNLTSKHHVENSNGEQKDFTIIWRNLSYKIRLNRWLNMLMSADKQRANGNHERIIFDKICGEAKSREITAIMGRSGAGKSSLLSCLFRNKSKGVTGQILVNSKSKKRLRIAFIPQHDYLNEWLTVREDLMFVSKLQFRTADDLQHSIFFRGNSGVQDAQKLSEMNHERNATQMARLFGLMSCLDVRIKRISGGERKRLAIAREFMSKPDIIVLDEPTTGLDSLACYKTIRILRDLAKNSHNPTAVVLTIHQPERAVFNLFDKTYFLSDGHGITFDEDPKNAVEVMENIGKISLPSANYNPANFLIELGSEKVHFQHRVLLTNYQRLRFDECNSSSKIVELLGHKGLKAIQVSKGASSNMGTQEDIESNLNGGNNELKLLVTNNNSGMLEPSNPDSYFMSHQLQDCINSQQIGWSEDLRHILILRQRAWLSIIRNPSLTKSRLALHVLLPLFMLAVFGTEMGSKTSCPVLGECLELDRMKKDIQEGTVSKVYDDYRFVTENLAFLFTLFFGFSINIVCLAASFYPITLASVKKETGNGLYSIGSSLIAQMIAELPLEIFFHVISTILAYKLTGQVESPYEWRMLTLCFMMFTFSYLVHSIGLICGILLNDNVTSAVILAMMINSSVCTTSGFVKRYSRLPAFMKPFADGSYFKHYLSGIIAARYGFNLCACDDESLADSKNTFLSPNLEHTMDYLFENDTQQLGVGVKISDLFDKLNNQFMEAQTYGMKLDTCQDLRPYVMETYVVEDNDLFVSLAFSIIGIVLLKCVVYTLLKHVKM